MENTEESKEALTDLMEVMKKHAILVERVNHEDLRIWIGRTRITLANDIIGWNNIEEAIKQIP